MEEKILEKLDILEKKIDELTEMIKGTPQKYSSSLSSQDSDEEGPKPSEVAAKKIDQSIGMMLESERIVCPKCQSINIQAIDNKEKPLSMSGGIMIYSKKYYCKKCAYQWE